MRCGKTRTLDFTAVSSRQKLILFYSVAALLVSDGFAIAHRFTLDNPDPISWVELIVAVVGQGCIVVVLVALLPLLTHQQNVGRVESALFGSFGVKAVAFIVLGLFAALSVTLLNHGMTCGDHPIPSKGTPNVCPK